MTPPSDKTSSAESAPSVPASHEGEDFGTTAPTKRDAPVLPAWATSWETVRSATEVRVRRAGRRLAFHGVRVPVYGWRMVARGCIGTVRGVRLLYRWITHAEAAPLRRKALADLDRDGYLDLYWLRQDHIRSRGAAAALLGVAVIAGLAGQAVAAPSTLLIDAVVAWAAAVWLGRDHDDPDLLDTPELPVRLDLNVEHLNAALRAVGILRGKDDDQDAPRLVMVQRPMRDRNGWSTVWELPRGTGKSAADVLKVRDRIAAELGIDEIQLDMKRVRAAHQGNAARISMWVCDEDPYLQETPTPSPLADMEQFSLWQPVPFGRDARHNRIDLPIMWQSMFFGGLPRRGKTAAQRILSAAGALDPTVRHWVADGKGGSDWRPMRRIAHRHVFGAELDAVSALERMLDEIIIQMEEAYRRLGSIPSHLAPDGKLTPQVITRYNLPLNLITIDELQEFLSSIPDTKRRDALVDRLARITRRGPAAGYIFNYATQRPDADSVPTRLREIVTMRYCTQVIDRATSDMVLGKNKAAQGADASILSEEHLGVGVLVTGPASFATVLTDYIDLPAFADICERGRALRIEAGTLSGDATDDTLSGEGAQVMPEVLADVLTVMRHVDRMHTTDILNRLVNMAPSVYGDWNADRLAEALELAGVRRTTRQVWIEGANRNGYYKADLVAAAEMYASAST